MLPGWQQLLQLISRWEPEIAISTGSFFYGMREPSDLTLVLRQCCKKLRMFACGDLDIAVKLIIYVGADKKCSVWKNECENKDNVWNRRLRLCGLSLPKCKRIGVGALKSYAGSSVNERRENRQSARR